MLSEEQANPLTAEPSRFDEKQIKIDGETKWLYAAIHTDSKHLLAIDVFSHHQNAPRLAGERELRSHQRRGTDPAAAFLHRLTEKHDVSEAEFLVNAAGYLTALFCLD